MHRFPGSVSPALAPVPLAPALPPSQGHPLGLRRPSVYGGDVVSLWGLGTNMLTVTDRSQGTAHGLGKQPSENRNTEKNVCDAAHELFREKFILMLRKVPNQWPKLSFYESINQANRRTNKDSRNNCKQKIHAEINHNKS